MADNYLERKMEDYRSGKGGTSKIKRVSLNPKQGTVNVKFPPRRVFVTGGASGIGRAIVEAFRKVDCRVAFCDIDTKVGMSTAQATGAQFYPVDMRDVNALEACMTRLLDAWGDIDVIVNNVGLGCFVPLVESTVDDFDNVLASNLRPVFVTARRLAIHRTHKLR